MSMRGHDRLSALLFGPKAGRVVKNLKLFPGDFSVPAEELRDEVASALNQIDTPGLVASHTEFDERHLPDVDVATWVHAR